MTVNLRTILMGLLVYFLSSSSVYSQTLTDEEKLQWFVVRFPFWLAYGFVLGTIVSLAWLRRVKYMPESLSLDGKVRRRFLVALLLSLIVFGASVWLDVWLVYSFENMIHDPVEAISEVSRSWQTFVFMSLAALMFYVAGLFWTRGAFSGRYALWPGPKRQ